MNPQEKRIKELETELAELTLALARTAETVSTNMRVIEKGVRELKEMLTTAQAERDEARAELVRKCAGACSERLCACLS